MKTIELIIESFATLTLNKTRTGLAILGIVIGIGSVIALMSLGQASQQSVQTQIQSLGSNLLTIQPGSQKSGNVMGASGGSDSLTLADARAISSSTQITTIQTVSPELSKRTQITTGSSNSNTQVIGVEPAYADVHKITLSNGNFIVQSHLDSMSNVAIIGSTTSTNLFGDGVDPIGQTLRISGKSFTVIGVTVSKGGTGFQNQDDIIYIPLSVAQKQIFGSTSLSSIAVEAKNAEVMTQAQDEIGYLLLGRHSLTDPAAADFSIMSQQDLLKTVSSVTGSFVTLLAGVAAISLIVGGIGIMNIMLVTVTERTREIGLRKALGAKKKTITTQFLIESIILTFTGGVIGVFLGILTSYVISSLTKLPFVISPSSIFLAFSVSVAIGILFGWYPAKKAAGLQPIQALRYE